MEPTSGWFSFGGNGNTPTNSMRMGYCPQMDALDYLLTVKETLDIYAKLRGLSSKILNKVKKNWVFFTQKILCACTKL